MSKIFAEMEEKSNDVSEHNITICKTVNPSEYLSKIDKNDADAEFVFAVSENNEKIQAIFYENVPVGLAFVWYGRQAFLYVYIFPEYRRRGYGRIAVSMLEKQLHTPQLRKIMTCYRSDDKIMSAFAKSYGYTKKYAAEYMIYRGPLFEIGEVPVRRYRDEDYLEAHAMYAEAFHVMRLGTGCFPESIPEAPTDGMRKFWSDTADDRLVYLMDDEIVGYAHIEGSEIGSVSVKLTHQREGIGEKFVKYIINKLMTEGHEEVSLYCVVGNYRARRLYDRIGCTKICCNDYAVKEFGD